MFFFFAFFLIGFPSPSAPVFYFGEMEYSVDESAGYVEVRVWRTGTDLSKAAAVTVRSRKTDPVSAEGKVDRHTHPRDTSNLTCQTT